MDYCLFWGVYVAVALRFCFVGLLAEMFCGLILLLIFGVCV